MLSFDNEDSSVIAPVFWDDNEMLVTLRSGLAYEYANVPLWVFEEFRDAQSLGYFYNTEVKGKFPSAAVNSIRSWVSNRLPERPVKTIPAAKSDNINVREALRLAIEQENWEIGARLINHLTQ